MRVRITTNTHYGAMDVELEGDQTPDSLLDGDGPVKLKVTVNDTGEQGYLHIRKRAITSVEEWSE